MALLLEKFIQKNIPIFFSNTDKILLAVSGGIDSMVLADLCLRSKLNIAIAHCNFQLRGEDSIADENFVKDFAKKNQLKFYVKQFDTLKTIQEEKKGVQEVARKLRYEWFAEIGEKENFIYLFTAHHANDNTETLFMNFCKGTGIKGLRGMQIKQNKIIRPLLFAHKQEILEYAESQKIVFREDSSNAKNIYTRNAFRLNIIPEIKKIYPNLENNLLANAKRFLEIEKIYEEYFNNLKKQLFQPHKNEIKISIKNLLKQEPFYTSLYEMFKGFGMNENQVPELEKLLGAMTGKYILIGDYKFLINRKHLLVYPQQTSEEESYFIINELPEKKEISATQSLLFEGFEIKDATISTEKHTACLDAKNIEFPLIIRLWKAGDYFYPLGLGKKKKLNKFFNDIKLSAKEKTEAWVIESNKKIIWVVNHRIDDRFKINANTKKGLKISFVL